MTGVNSVNGAASTNPLAGWEKPKVAAANNTQMDKDTFLKLLVAQVKNQNPAEPMNPNEMMTQMAQLTTVDKLNQLVEATTNSNAMTKLTLAGALVGKTVSWLEGETERSAAVSGVRLDGDSLLLTVGSTEIDASKVTRVQ
jgi:flagellar basal-body rod modification protein FlgD